MVKSQLKHDLAGIKHALSTNNSKFHISHPQIFIPKKEEKIIVNASRPRHESRGRKSMFKKDQKN